MPSTLYCSITGVTSTNIVSVSVTANHDSPTSTAIIECLDTSLTLGDSVTIDFGYVGNHSVLFTGYVKQIERKIPDDTLVVTAYDVLIRAQDYFIASTNPKAPLTFKGISAEDLVQELMEQAGLTSFDGQATYFTFGINNSFEINLVSPYDYTRTICDLLTWSLWADSNGTVNFKNRKPYVMLNQYPENAQPGWAADTATGYDLNQSTNLIDISYTITERSLRNRVVVYGAENIYAEAKAASAYLPAGFYKTSVLAFPQLIDSTGLAQNIADYNLDLQNRILQSAAVNVIGDPTLRARTVISANNTGMTEMTGNWYVFGCDHSFSTQGYVTTMELRRMIKA